MQKKALVEKLFFLPIISFLVVLGLLMIVENFQGFRQSMLETTEITASNFFLWFCGVVFTPWKFFLGLNLLHEGGMLLFRYVFGLRGKNERMYLVRKNTKIGLHHYHWGMLLLVFVVIAVLSYHTTNPCVNLMAFLGVSMSSVDLLHHQVLRIIHGDTEGDGESKLLKWLSRW